MLTKSRLMQIIKEEVAQAMGANEPEDAAEDMFAGIEDSAEEAETPTAGTSVTPNVVEPEDDETVEAEVTGEVDHEAIAETAAVASEMLSALEDFEEKATPDMQNAISSELARIKEKLLDMVMDAEKYSKRRNLEPETE